MRLRANGGSLSHRYFDCTFTVPMRRAATAGDGNGSGNLASLVMSTGPEEEYTHWKQTVMYLHEPIRLHEGDAVSGTIFVCPNANNSRDLDINVEYAYEDGPEASLVKRTQAWRMR